MKKRFNAQFKALVLVLSLCLVVASSGGGITKASSLPPEQERAQDPSVISAIGTGITIITGGATILDWGRGKLSGNSKAEITKGFSRKSLDVELGLTYQLEFEAECRFDDTIALDEWAFFEVYVIKDGRQIYYNRYPDEGYIEQPGNWLDDSTTKKMKGEVYVGAKEWPCSNETDEVKVIACVWVEPNKLWPKYESKWVNKDPKSGEGGRLIGGERRGSLRLMGYDEDTMTVTVFNPYYVETIESDSGLNKDHGNTFGLKFKAHMQYKRTYPQIPIIDPEPAIATVTINPLQSKHNWNFETKSALSFNFVPGVLQVDERTIDYTGHHTVPGHPETCGTSYCATYSDDWGATVTGNNVIYYERDGKKVPHSYTWEAKFRPAPRKEDSCTPITYSVACLAPPETPPSEDYYSPVVILVEVQCIPKGENAELRLIVGAADPSGGEAKITGVEVLVDGSPFWKSEPVSVTNFANRLVVGEVSGGEHTIVARATNTRGQTATDTGSVECEVEGIPPPEETPSVEKTLSVSFQLSGQCTQSEAGCICTVNYSVTGEDISQGDKYPVTNVKLEVNDGTGWREWHNSGGISLPYYHHPNKETGVGCGKTFSVRATATNSIGQTVTATGSFTTSSPE